jgi:tRNA nucleotidyltransferase (CCA-adding enzyme)
VINLIDPLPAASRLVTPTRDDERMLTEIAERIFKKTVLAAKKYPEVTGTLLGGSLAKGTWLPGEADVDIFVKISPLVDERRFEEIGLKVGRKAVRGYPYGKKYAQHPYTEATVDGVKVNVVPCYDVRAGEWRSAADRSQYHVKFILENFDDTRRLQARLLKRFLGVIGVYGAEIETEGFSGYVAEVLVHDHGSLEGVVKFFANLKPVSDEVFFTLRDPIDSKRDLAKAISMESLAKMVIASRAYLKNPSIEFFSGKGRIVRRALTKKVIALRFDHAELSEDTLWGELKRTSRHLMKHLAFHGYRTVRTSITSDRRTKSAILLLPEMEELPELEERIGPHVKFAKESEEFTAKNRDRSEMIWVGEDGRLHSLQRRRYRSLMRLLEDIIGGQISELGASRDITVAILGTGKLRRGSTLAREARSEKWLREGLTELVSDTIGTDLG